MRKFFRKCLVQILNILCWASVAQSFAQDDLYLQGQDASTDMMRVSDVLLSDLSGPLSASDGAIVYVDSSVFATDDARFVWDIVNDALLLGTDTSPGSPIRLYILTTTNGADGLLAKNTSNGAAATTDIKAFNDDESVKVVILAPGSGFTTSGILTADTAAIQTTGSDRTLFANYSTSPFVWTHNGNPTTANTAMTLDTNGRLLLPKTGGGFTVKGSGTTFDVEIGETGDGSGRTVGVQRTTQSGSGYSDSLTISAGSPVMTGSDSEGGDITLKGGDSTGDADSHVRFYTAKRSASGSTDNIAAQAGYFDGNGSLHLTKEGGHLSIESGGTGPAIGKATLVGGTVTVNTTLVATSDVIHLTVQVAGGTQGNLSVGTVTAGTSFVINSDDPLDTSTVGWTIFKQE